jgi:hypothetical protein
MAHETRRENPRLENAGSKALINLKELLSILKNLMLLLAQEGHNLKLIRFGEQGASTAGKPKAGESAKMKKKRASFKARHAKNIKKGKMSAAYWADRTKW